MGPLFPLLAFPLARALKGGVKRLQHGSDNAALNLEQRGASALSSHVSQLVAEMRPCGRFELVNLVLAGKGSIPRRIDPSARLQDAMQLDGGELWCIIELAGVLLPRAIDGTMGASTAQPTAAASSSSSATPHAILPRASAYSLSLFPSLCLPPFASFKFLLYVLLLQNGCHEAPFQSEDGARRPFVGARSTLPPFPRRAGAPARPAVVTAFAVRLGSLIRLLQKFECPGPPALRVSAGLQAAGGGGATVRWGVRPQAQCVGRDGPGWLRAENPPDR